MARRYWGTASPFSSCIIAPPSPCARVVGIVSDVRDSPAGASPPMRFYVALPQGAKPAASIIVRTAPANVPAVAAAIRKLTPPNPRPTIDVVADRVGQALRPWNIATLLFVVLGGVALTLACVGIYSVMGYLVSERRHEMGVRLALGATGSQIVRLVLQRGLRLVLAGGVLGLGLAAVVGSFLGALLFEVSVTDPGVYSLAFGCVTLLAVCAILPPALRASRVDPVDALRVE
jgi:predicted lysophospholipase L1 biosynthesis ABC-type transport system permease subunit